MQQIDRVFRKNENFVFRQIDDETILVPIKNNVGDMGSIYNLNEVGAYVWGHLDGQKTLFDIKSMIVEAFEVTPEKAEDDNLQRGGAGYWPFRCRGKRDDYARG